MKKEGDTNYPLVTSTIEKYLTETLTSEQALSEYEKKHGDTHCEIVNENEIYLLRRNPDYNPSNPHSVPFIRGRRICGRLRTPKYDEQGNRGDRLRCLLSAGQGTNHVGYGMCHHHQRYYHPGGGKSQALRILEGLKKSGFALELSELDEIVGGVLNDPKIGEIDYEIAVLQKLLADGINQDRVSGKDIVACVDALVKAKTAKSKIETEKLLIDVNSIKLFVRAIFDILRRKLSPQKYSEIALEIQSKVVFPINKSMQDQLLARDADDDLDPDKEIID